MVKNKSQIRKSKFLSKILRHSAIEMNLPIDKKGYVKVEDILNLEGKEFTLEDIKEIVKNNNKNRFKLISVDNILYIRCNQGHSMMNLEIEMKEIKNLDDLGDLKDSKIIHRTFIKTFPEILESGGLNRMNRQHIHFSLEKNHKLPCYKQNARIWIFLNLEKALRDGYKFFLSENNVLLSPGNDKGFIPSEYFVKVLNKKKREMYI